MTFSLTNNDHFGSLGFFFCRKRAAFCKCWEVEEAVTSPCLCPCPHAWCWLCSTRGMRRPRRCWEFWMLRLSDPLPCPLEDSCEKYSRMKMSCPWEGAWNLPWYSVSVPMRKNLLELDVIVLCLGYQGSRVGIETNGETVFFFFFFLTK